MAISSSIPHVTVEIEEEEEENPYTYQYPSNLSATSFISVKLSGRDKYGAWKTQLLCLLHSHGMCGFIDGTLINPQKCGVLGKEKVGENHTVTRNHRLWKRSDALVKGWILGSLSEQTVVYVLDRLSEKLHHQDMRNADFSAKDVWNELQTIYAPLVLPQLLVADHQEEGKAQLHQDLYQATLQGNWIWVDRILNSKEVTVADKITNNGNTALHVAIGTTKRPEFVEKLLGLIPDNTSLLDVRNSDGSTLLHVAAIVGNTQAADILEARNPDLLFAKDNEGQTPLAIALSNSSESVATHQH